MTRPRHIAVIDIGKTNAKLALVDLETLTELAVVTRPNVVLPGPPWPHFDVEGHWAFLMDGLARFHRDHRIDAISVTTHGACAALLAGDGTLAAPILDYEDAGPDEIAADYDALRPPFAWTGSPRLPGGLNIGAQLHWQFATDPGLRDRTAQIVTYPQYWGHRLTGVAATDVTSLGCHTDLWLPREGRFSDLPDRLGITGKIAPARGASETLGPLLPEVAGLTGLPLETPVAVGIHDSNASLYPHLLTQRGAFTVVSTGTWVIVMSVRGRTVDLDPDRDTLINVDARGEPVPSARFMGGREYELLGGADCSAPTKEDVTAILTAPTMILPAAEPFTGPFQGRAMRWTGDEPAPGTGRRAVAIACYLALMADTCLRLTGAEGPTIVEGPFARNAQFLAMLSAATGRPVLRCETATGTAVGAALLSGGSAALSDPLQVADADPALAQYAERWRDRVTRTADRT